MEPSKLNRYDERGLYQYGGGCCSKGTIKKHTTNDAYKSNEILLKEYRILKKKYKNLEKKYEKLKEETTKDQS